MNTPIISGQNPEWVQINEKLRASGSVTARLIRELDALILKEQELNQKLMTALSQRQNARPIYIAVNSLLLERVRVFTELSANTADSSKLCLESAASIEKICGQATETGGEI